MCTPLLLHICNIAGYLCEEYADRFKWSIEEASLAVAEGLGEFAAAVESKDVAAANRCVVLFAIVIIESVERYVVSCGDNTAHKWYLVLLES